MVHQRVHTALESALCCRTKGRNMSGQSENKLQTSKMQTETFENVQNKSNADQLISNYMHIHIYIYKNWFKFQLTHDVEWLPQISTECHECWNPCRPSPAFTVHVWGELRRTGRVTRATECHKHCRHALWLLYC